MTNFAHGSPFDYIEGCRRENCVRARNLRVARYCAARGIPFTPEPVGEPARSSENRASTRTPRKHAAVIARKPDPIPYTPIDWDAMREDAKRRNAER